MPRTILWDLMDTLVRDPFFTHMPGFFGLTLEQLIAQKHPTAWRDFELGRIGEEELYARFFRDRRPIDGPGLRAHMQSGYSWIEGIPELLEQLAARQVPMHLLSNYPPWYRLCDAQLGVSRLVAPSFVSCNTGVRKPDPEAYLGASRALGVAPNECLFVDDRAPNCDAARAVGMDAVRFEGSVPALREALYRRGLLEAPA